MTAKRDSKRKPKKAKQQQQQKVKEPKLGKETLKDLDTGADSDLVRGGAACRPGSVPW